MSPARRCTPRSASASSQTRSSSARPTTSARTPSSMHLLDRDDLAGELGLAGQDDVEALVEHDLGAAVERRRASMSGCSGDPHLAAAGEDVDGAVVVLADDDAVGRRRLGELVDLVAQRGDVLARLAQGVAELLVLGDGLGQLALGLEQPLLEGAHPLGRVGQLRAQARDLLLERPDLLAQLRQLGLLGSSPCVPRSVPSPGRRPARSAAVGPTLAATLHVACVTSRHFDRLGVTRLAIRVFAGRRPCNSRPSAQPVRTKEAHHA